MEKKSKNGWAEARLGWAKLGLAGQDGLTEPKMDQNAQLDLQGVLNNLFKPGIERN